MPTGFLSVPIMRSNPLHVSILAVLLLTLNADSAGPDCEDEIHVRRNKGYKASPGAELQIECPVRFCSDSPPTVSWSKSEDTRVPVNVSSSSHIRAEWKYTNHSTGTSYLIFQKILTSDAGVYLCHTEGSVSHEIIVSVHDAGEHANVTPTTTNSTLSGSEPTDDLWMYVYTAAGIVAFVIMVIIISVASMLGCKGKSKKDTQTDNQYMAIPMVEHPVQASPRGSPSAPPSRRSTRRKTAPSRPDELTDNKNLYGKVQKDREGRGNMAEEAEGSSVVYAALNHQLQSVAAARPRRPKEEASEYAAIRVKDY